MIIPRSAKGFNVTKICCTAFVRCDVASVTLSRYDKENRNGRFLACIKLNSITIPDGVSRIEKYAFEGCSAEIYYKGNIYTEENYGEIYKMFE